MTTVEIKTPVTICLSTFHRPVELERAIRSVQNQTFEEFTAWIVKDGCSASAAFDPKHCEKPLLECDLCKSTVKLGKEVANVDPRFRFFSLPANFGGHAWGPRNFVVQNSEAEFITYLDDDNWIEPEHIDSLLKILLETEADVAIADSYIIEMGQCVGIRRHGSHFCYGQIDTSEIMHRRDLVDRCGGWKDDRVVGANDWDIFSRWQDEDVSIALTKLITVNYTRTPKATWVK